MSFGIDDDGKQSQFNANSQDDGFRYVIADVWDLKRLFYDEVDDAHEHSVEAEDDHRADWDVDDDWGFVFVCTAPEVDDGEDREETDDEIEGDMSDEIILIDMPIEEDEAKSEGRNANEEIFFEVCFFQIAVVAG